MTSEPLHDLASRLRHLADPAAAPGVPDAELLRRFADGRDEVAFELLVWRHGGMVLATCRRVLGRSADAEDAFQATFLTLVRKAGAVRRGVTLAGWLHRVAVRAALRLRGSVARRATGEAIPEPVAPPAPPPDDTAAVLDEEIGRLPEKLRVAFVLCHLEGRTNEEAAARIGCPKGTVLSRLSRARERLRDRLARRGVGVPAAGLAALTAPTPLTASLVGGVARSAGLFAAGRAGGVIPGHVLTLTHGVLRTMRLDQLKPFAALAAVAALATGVVLAARHDAPEAPPPRPSGAEPPPAVAPAKPEPREFKLATADRGVTYVDAVRFSPDGKWVVTTGRKRVKGDQDGPAVVVWDAATGGHAHTSAAVGAFPELDFSPDGKILAVASLDNMDSVTLLEVGTWKKLATLRHELPSQVRFSPDGKLLATGSLFTNDSGGRVETRSEVKVWTVPAGELRFTRAPKAGEGFESAAFAPDGGTLAAGTRGAVHLIDVRTGKDRAVVRTPDEGAVGATFSPDGKRLLTWPGAVAGSAREADQVVRAWDPATGKELFAFPLGGTARWPGHPLFSPDGKWAAVVPGRPAMAVKLWDAETGKRVAALRREPTWVLHAVFTPDGGHLAVLAALGGDGVEEVPGGPDTAPVGALFTLPGVKEVTRLPGAKLVAFDPARGAVALVTGAALSPADGDPADVVTVRDLAGLLKPAP